MGWNFLWDAKVRAMYLRSAGEFVPFGETPTGGK
jgi:hypothetical protein